MAAAPSFPYETRLNILHKPLEVIDEKVLADACDDEFFYVVDGQLFIDLEGRTLELSPRQGIVVPKGVMHRTRAQLRTVILMVENAGIIPTGS